MLNVHRGGSSGAGCERFRRRSGSAPKLGTTGSGERYRSHRPDHQPKPIISDNAQRRKPNTNTQSIAPPPSNADRSRNQSNIRSHRTIPDNIQQAASLQHAVRQSVRQQEESAAGAATATATATATYTVLVDDVDDGADFAVVRTTVDQTDTSDLDSVSAFHLHRHNRNTSNTPTTAKQQLALPECAQYRQQRRAARYTYTTIHTILLLRWFKV